MVLIKLASIESRLPELGLTFRHLCGVLSRRLVAALRREDELFSGHNQEL